MTNILDKAFYTSIALKGIDGFFQLLVGLLLLVIPVNTLNNWAHSLHYNHEISTHITIYGAIYLLSHGAIKLFIVIALLRQKLWAYPWMIGFLGLFIVYQLYHMIFVRFTWGFTFLTIFDIFVVWLTWLEYKKHRAKKHAISNESDAKETQ
jgi:uncharacterized membrane protein